MSWRWSIGSRRRGFAPAFRSSPKRPLEAIRPVSNLSIALLVMTVNPGFGGQRLIEGRPREGLAALRDSREREGGPF